ncbi:uncharacterized protein EDB91DRAFT_476771 [Suillus paluster]|uniref:uncharacterized protein n=1 Tax=Suillus paluster TaxID=48578 RepID=UPI001B8827FF|nr:uncharacterized protein EDB91DRAFT_476771 [Suillus paluster]KAG1737464.1 hypothetical protein EDB91DRAFT_476771 [Suillus paluster]
MVSNTLDRMFITSVWFESIIYGIKWVRRSGERFTLISIDSCVLFGACIYILANRNRKSHRILFLSCIFHISVSTAHNVISLLQSLEGFTTPAIISVPNGSSLYFVTTTALFIANLALYIANVLAQDLLLIWRLYIVWNHNWKLVIVFLIVEAAHITCAITSVVLIAQPSEQLFSQSVQAFGKASWSLDLFLNTFVTSGIAYCLWHAGREVSDFTGRNVYKAAMFTIIESGALIASCTVVMFALDIAGSPAGLMAVNVAVQIATTTPLLIIARLGLGLTHGDTHFEKSSSIPAVTFAPPVQVNIAEEHRVIIL